MATVALVASSLLLEQPCLLPKLAVYLSSFSKTKWLCSTQSSANLMSNACILSSLYIYILYMYVYACVNFVAVQVIIFMIL